jgi:hypothetical protein
MDEWNRIQCSYATNLSVRLQVTLKAGSFVISKVFGSSRKTQYCELITKIYVNMFVASIIDISHASDIMVWVEVTQIWMWLG